MQIAKGCAHLRHVRSRSVMSTRPSHRARGRGTTKRSSAVPQWHLARRLVARSSLPRGSGAATPGPHLVFSRRVPYRKAAADAMDADAPMDAQTASTAAWKSRWTTRDSHSAHSTSPLSFRRTIRPKTRTAPSTLVEIHAVSDERRHSWSATAMSAIRPMSQALAPRFQ
jgi:hypothetical protein